jgi:hypothetical protein
MIIYFVFNIEQILEPLQPVAAIDRIALGTFRLATCTTVMGLVNHQLSKCRIGFAIKRT